MTAVGANARATNKAASSLFAALGFGLSGAAFTLGMLLLARELPVEAYGRFTLAVALFNIFGLLTPLGVDQLFLRGPMRAGKGLLAFLILSGLVVGGVVGMAAGLLGGLHPAEAWLTALAIAGGGLVAATSTGLRARAVPGASMLLAISASFVLLLAGTAAVAFGLKDGTAPLAIFAAGNIVFGAIGWGLLRRRAKDGDAVHPARRWREAGSMLGLVALGTVSLQVERIIIPIPLDLKELALFGVLASVAIFPFRLLASGVGFTLAPRLIGAQRARRQAVVLAEARPLLAVIVVATAGLVACGPWIAAMVTGGLYAIGPALILAACANGVGKVAMAFPRAMLTAAGSPADLVLLNGWGVVGLALTVCGALAGAACGITGLLWGATLGGAIPTLFTLHLAWRRLGKD
ncbi:polysaccharide biosynthesis protein [Sphingobium sp. PNB]|uniref:polysaccharide biosynthesis protein n=1 Tax=Sphingobium sp. PNB TaxID=863934 RepID=UPI001CA3B070|nr:polysaccharide biosynthesis protein [Sphingobium sp. PNB]MCB4858071.1 polysaccharide biosynthesis protein [Sphingobium sp. PNB]